MKKKFWPAAVWIRSVAIGLGALAWLALTSVMIVSALPADQKLQVQNLLADVLLPRLPLMVLTALMALAGLAFWLASQHKQGAGWLGELAERVRLAQQAETPTALKVTGTPAQAELLNAINTLILDRLHSEAELTDKVAEASQRIEQERRQLATLMAELSQSVVVCNREGRVLLYNNRARLQFRLMSSTQVASGAELMGIGRSIYQVLDKALVDHAIDQVQTRLERGASSPTAEFVTFTRSGQMLKVQLAAVRSAQADQTNQMDGFVLVLENVTDEFEQHHARSEALYTITERSRAAIAIIRAAIEIIGLPDIDEPTRARFRGVISSEVDKFTQQIAQLAQESSSAIQSHWLLQEVLLSELIQAASRRVEQLCNLHLQLDLGVAAGVWLKADSYSMIQAFTHQACSIHRDTHAQQITLKADVVDGKLQLDFVWTGDVPPSNLTAQWENGPMQVGDQTVAVSVHDVAQKHGAAVWVKRLAGTSDTVVMRWMLPISSTQSEAIQSHLKPTQERPEFFDFDLFRMTAQTHAMDDRKLTDLTFTVFDTETTGLNPSQGDEIIQIGAVRVVNQKIVSNEYIDQLVDPCKPIPAITIPVHGISDDMVQGQPKITEVLPVFHQFAADTVIVAHNAAFDMRFLELKTPLTGLRFDQPVLDTLLLSAVVHPKQESHRLDALAERFGLVIHGRHTAMGDAMVTAQVFLKLIPLLEAMGITTLGQAREAAQKTFYARLKY